MSYKDIQTARVGNDVCKRGRVWRGAYICDAAGVHYLDKNGAWTNGVKGELNWWDDQYHAEKFLTGIKKKALEEDA